MIQSSSQCHSRIPSYVFFILVTPYLFREFGTGSWPFFDNPLPVPSLLDGFLAFFSAPERGSERQRGRALAGASRVAKGRGGVDYTARSNHRLSCNSALKKADSLRHFLLKKVAKHGFLHIIEKPVEMNRPPTRVTSPTDGGAAGRPTQYRPPA